MFVERTARRRHGRRDWMASWTEVSHAFEAVYLQDANTYALQDR
jgi:hypothetical protein